MFILPQIFSPRSRGGKFLIPRDCETHLLVSVSSVFRDTWDERARRGLLRTSLEQRTGGAECVLAVSQAQMIVPEPVEGLFLLCYTTAAEEEKVRIPLSPSV